MKKFKRALENTTGEILELNKELGLYCKFKEGELDNIGEILDKDKVFLTNFQSLAQLKKLKSANDVDTIIDELNLKVRWIADSLVELCELAYDEHLSDEELHEFEINNDFYVVLGNKHILLED